MDNKENPGCLYCKYHHAYCATQGRERHVCQHDAHRIKSAVYGDEYGYCYELNNDLNCDHFEKK